MEDVNTRIASIAPRSCRPAVLDWMETHSRIMGFWLDRLIAEGDESDIVSMLHRQQSWLDMMQMHLCHEG